MNRKRFKFDVSTSKCFICFVELLEVDSEAKLEFFSLQTIFQYLKITLKNIESLSKKPQTLLNKTDVRMRLCSECERSIKAFSELYKTLAVIKIKLNYNAKVIQNKLLNASKAGHVLEEYEEEIKSSSAPTSSNLKTVKHFKLAKELRDKIIEKCNKEVGTNPKVKLEKLNEVEIRKLNTSHPKEGTLRNIVSVYTQEDSGNNLGSFQWVVLKTEFKEEGDDTVDVMPMEDEMDDDEYDNGDVTLINGGMSTSIDKNELTCPDKSCVSSDPSAVKSQYDVVHPKPNHKCDLCQATFLQLEWLESHKKECASSASSTALKAKLVHATLQNISQSICSRKRKEIKPPKPLKGIYYSRDPVTRMFLCKQCNKTFVSRTGAAWHFESIHLKIRLKCNICRKTVANDPSGLSRHMKICQRNKDRRFKAKKKVAKRSSFSLNEELNSTQEESLKIIIVTHEKKDERLNQKVNLDIEGPV